ncbi:MAG: ABC transporter substrate-binding protein [Planctomycetota bacterium]|jgi:putative ABC transport system substrate-binding protein
MDTFLRAAAVPAMAVALFLCTAVSTSGQEPEDRRPRIGVLFWHDSPNDREAFEGVRDGFSLAERDPVFEVVEAEGDDEAARKALRDFEKRGLDLVYALGTGAALRARDELKNTPVVFTAVTDPVGSGVVKTLEGSGDRLCGTASGVAADDVLRVFRLALPELSSLGVLHDPENPVSRAEVAAMTAAARRLDPPVTVTVSAIPAKKLREVGSVEAATAELLKDCDALWVPIDISVYGREAEVARAAETAQRPVLATAPAASRNAAAVCVAADFRAVGRKSVVLAVRCLDGGDPGKLPVTRPRAYRVILNLEAAKRTGFRMPLSLLVSADEFAGVAGGR